MRTSAAERMRRFDFAQRKAVIAIVMALAVLLSVCSAKAEAQTDAPAAFIGAVACAGCHAPETERWKTSHHALAMQKAAPPRSSAISPISR